MPVVSAPRGRRFAAAASACLLLSSLALAAPAVGAKRAKVTASEAARQGCHTRYVGNRAHTDVVRVTATETGLVRARLKGRGDWDLGVFDARAKRYVAGSAAFAGNELAEGFATKGQRLLVQACRFRGRARSARVAVGFVATPPRTGATAQVVDVSTPSRRDKRRLQGLGLDLTEHGDADSVEVVLYDEAGARKLRDNKFRYQVRIADLGARVRVNLRTDRRYRARVSQRGGSALPSGRSSYRRLADYELELKQLAARYPDHVRPFRLPHRTHLGRDVLGIEITHDAYELEDGKPIFLNLGVHHAREWPSGEHALEWAYDLLTNYGEGGRTRRLVRGTRNIVIPIVNPDGFNISREAAPLGDFGPLDYEVKRTNCWPDPDNPGPCDNNPAGRFLGVDLNRNYGTFWGGPGATPTPLTDVFRGTQPFSEPETENIRKLHSERQITNLITNHTFSNLILRPPGVADTGPPLEEPLLRDLGARMASHNGYSNIPGYGLYDTTGTTEDWTFWSAGGLGYTFEIGGTEFHPPYEQGVVAEYLGRAPAVGAGNGGNREAYYEMLESTADRHDHSLITGRAPEDWTLRIHKSFMSATSPVWNDDFGTDIGNPILFPDALESELESEGGRFRWHINPSTRPVVAGRLGRDPTGPPQASIPLANPAGIPAENLVYPEAPYDSIPFTVAGPPEVDNGRMTVHIEWTNPATDWDLYIANAAGEVVSQSAAFGDTTEDAVLVDPPPGEYTAHVVNYDQVVDPPAPLDDWTGGEVRFESPTPTSFGEKEAWMLTCEDDDGRLRATRSVVVDRGERLHVGDVCKRSFSIAAKRK